MPDLYPVKNNFTSGEISPNLWGRRDLAAYVNALATCQNAIPQPQGGVFGRGGFVWVLDGLVGGYGQNVRLIPFVFNQNILNSYLIEIGFSSVTSKSYIQVFSAYGTPAIVGSTITTTDTGADLPWGSADIPNIDYCQINDILYLTDGVHPLYKLVRSGDSTPFTWTVGVASLISSDLLIRESIEYRMSVAPVTSRAFPWGTNINTFNSLWDDPGTSLSNYNYTGYHDPSSYLGWGTTVIANDTEAVPSYISDRLQNHLIDGLFRWGWSMSSRLWIPNNGTTKWYFAINSCGGYLKISGKTLSTGLPNTYVVDDLTSASPNLADETEYAVNNWLSGGINASNLKVGEGNGFVARVAIDSNRATAGVYGIALAWRDDGQIIAGGTYTGRPAPVISSVDWNGNNCFQVKITITTAGAVGVAKFKVEVQEQLTINDVDTFGSYVEIDTDLSVNGYTSAGAKYQAKDPTEAFNIGKLYFTQTGTCTLGDYWTCKFGWLPMTASSMQRRSSTASDSTNLNPRHVTFFESRLWLCGFDVEPFRVIGSRSGQLENFSVSAQALDTDAVDILLMKDQSNPIVGATSSKQGLIILTSGGIFSIHGVNGPITPSSFKSDPVSDLRAAEVRPVSVDNSVLFVEAGKRNIQKITYDALGETFAPDNVTLLCDHLTRTQVFELAYTPSFITKGNAPAIKMFWFIEGTTTKALRSITLEDAHKVRGVAKHTLLNTSNVLSICALPSSSGGDDLYALIKYTPKSTLGNTIVKYFPATYNDTFSTTGGTLNYFQRIETLPPEIDLPFGTGQDFNKRWINLNLTLKSTSGLTVIPLWNDTVSLAQATSISGTPADANYKILGWDKDVQLRIQQTTGASMEILSMHGKLAVSIK